MFKDFPKGRFYKGDCLEVMKEIPDNCIDMILCDLPYGTTQNKWDSIIPLDLLWAQYERLCKGSIVLTSAMPFSAMLVSSKLSIFKYDLVFEKSCATGHLNANRMPMRKHEDILVFGHNVIYNPQKQPKLKANIRPEKNKSSATSSYGTNNPNAARTDSVDMAFPQSIIPFNNSSKGGDKGLHPTQKPVALFEYLIKTYSNEGMLILDNTAGSGTTAIAAINTGRKWVCIEQDETYFNAACQRIENHIVPTSEIDDNVLKAAE